MVDKRPEQPRERHPDKYLKDLNPDDFQAEKAEESVRTLNDLKEAHERFPGFTADNLKTISILPSGTPLEEGDVYINLKEPVAREFVATGGMHVGEDDWIVSKRMLPYDLRNYLEGETNREKTTM